MEQLCDREEDASLHAVAQRLNQPDGAPDTDAFFAALRTMETNLQAVPLGPDAVSILDAARQARRTLEADTSDPAARSEAASIVRQALLELETLLCPASAS
ncbi:MAG TPA: hypothetical protein VK992_02805 [Candidatus Caenarcaniphilales bacterium]|nr:hypothetical protein [Candidatus Caenarcaniphilales bacterium]